VIILDQRRKCYSPVILVYRRCIRIPRSACVSRAGATAEDIAEEEGHREVVDVLRAAALDKAARSSAHTEVAGTPAAVVLDDVDLVGPKGPVQRRHMS
jgi:hypothetical protein